MVIYKCPMELSGDVCAGGIAVGLSIERTHDMAVVRSILSHPRVWQHLHDDGMQEPSPVDHEGFFWMLVADDEPAGVFLLHAHNTICYEVHTALLPRIWGTGANEAYQLCAAWVFEETPCLKVITHVPTYNLRALAFAERCGFCREGLNRASFLKEGKLLDRHLLGLTKEDWQCQQQFQ